MHRMHWTMQSSLTRPAYNSIITGSLVLTETYTQAWFPSDATQ